MQHIRIALLGLFVTMNATVHAADDLVPKPLYEILPADSEETIIAKAAHVVPTPRQMDYHRREYIAFIHWGPNAFSKREWGSGMENPGLFNPSNLDSDQWCRAMKAAGMRLVVMVVKHHDGYCLWQTRYTKHGVMSSPWRGGKGDVLRDLSVSCKKHGLQLGVYLSPADLYQIESKEGLYGNGSKYSERVIPRPVEGRPFKDTRTFRYKVDDYNEYCLNQLFELLTEYGPVHEVWFDGAHPKRKGNQQYTHASWYELIRTLVPDAVIFGKGPDVRWCGNEGGHTRTAEWNVIPLPVHPDQCTWPDLRAQDLGSRAKLLEAKYLYYLPPEINTSIRHGWFYRDDTHQQVRSAADVFDMYERAVGGNGVFMLNIPPNREGMFSPRDVAALEESGHRVRETYGTDLLDGATASAPAVLDGKPDTFWMPGLPGETCEISLPKRRTVNRFVLQEALARHGQRVEEHVVEARVAGAWREVAKGTTIGYKKILRFTDVETDAFRLRVPKSRLKPTICAVSAHYFAPQPLPVAIKAAGGRVEFALSAGQAFAWNARGRKDPGAALGRGMAIHYTLDGTEPTARSPRYEKPLDLPEGGWIKTRSIAADRLGPVAERVIGLDSTGWRVLSVSSVHAETWAAEKAFDGNPATFWHTSWTGGETKAPKHPHHLAIDLGREVRVTGFTYLPRQDKRVPDSMVEACRFETSADGKTWFPAAEGTFGNLLNDPTERVVHLDVPVAARYVRFVSLRGVAGKPYAGAAEIGVLAKSAKRSESANTTKNASASYCIPYP